MAERLHFLFRWQQRGGHVHVAVFAGNQYQAENQARPKLGDLIMEAKDWSQFQQLVGIDFGARPHVEFAEHTLSTAGVADVRPTSAPAVGHLSAAGEAPLHPIPSPAAGPAGVDPDPSAAGSGR